MKLLDGKKISLIREQKGWSQRQLAEVAQVDQSIISRLERGLQEDYLFSNIASVALVLNVPIDALLIESNNVGEETFVPELAVVVLHLGKQSERVQRHAAIILAAYLSTVDVSD